MPTRTKTKSTPKCAADTGNKVREHKPTTAKTNQGKKKQGRNNGRSRGPCKLREIKLRPSQIRFTQCSISNTFSDGSLIGNLLDDIFVGRCFASAIKPIEVVWTGEKWFSNDNRRLWILKQLEHLNKIELVTVKRVRKIVQTKFTTKNDGFTVTIRTGHPGGIMYDYIERNMPHLKTKWRGCDADNEPSDDVTDDVEIDNEEYEDEEYVDDYDYDSYEYSDDEEDLVDYMRETGLNVPQSTPIMASRTCDTHRQHEVDLVTHIEQQQAHSAASPNITTAQNTGSTAYGASILTSGRVYTSNTTIPAARVGQRFSSNSSTDQHDQTGSIQMPGAPQTIQTSQYQQFRRHGYDDDAESSFTRHNQVYGFNGYDGVKLTPVIPPKKQKSSCIII